MARHCLHIPASRNQYSRSGKCYLWLACSRESTGDAVGSRPPRCHCSPQDPLLNHGEHWLPPTGCLPLLASHCLSPTACLPHCCSPYLLPHCQCVMSSGQGPRLRLERRGVEHTSHHVIHPATPQPRTHLQQPRPCQLQIWDALQTASGRRPLQTAAAAAVPARPGS